MGFLKKNRERLDAWKYVEPDSRPSLVTQFGKPFAGMPDWMRKASIAGLCVIAVLLCVLCLIYSIMRVYSTPTETNDQAVMSATNDETDEASRYEQYFYQMDNWSFLPSSARSSVENQIYEALLQDEGFKSGSFVYALDDYDSTDSSFIAYFYDTPREQYWRATIEDGSWLTTIEKVDYKDTPQPPGAELLEEDEAQMRGTPVTGDQPTDIPDDALILSEIDKMNGSLSSAAIQAIPQIFTLAQADFDFTADAKTSWIDGSSIIRDGDNCTFMIQLQNSDGKTLALNLAYNAQNNTYSAHGGE